MRGTYRFYQNGELLAEASNLITSAGLIVMLRRLADQPVAVAGALGLGVMATTATTADTRLGFEVDRVNIDVKVPDFSTTSVVYKATIPQNTQYTIYEAGVWSQVGGTVSPGFASRLLAVFDSSTETWSNSVADTTNARTSSSAARVDVTASATVATRSVVSGLDLSGYSGNDQFLVTFYKPNNNIAGLTLVFEDTATGGALRSTEVIVSALPVGYNKITIQKSTLVASGTIDWASIDRFGLDVRAGATGGYVSLDGIRLEDTDTVDQDLVLVSHSILPTPLVKTNVAPMEIEYALEVAAT